MDPLLSVCLITYNHKGFIRQAIEGVLMQQVNFPIEIIIADDFSTDGTREIVIEYQQKHPDLIKLILQEKNVGAAQNWIDLIYAPQSKYIAYFEGDDYWLASDKLQKQVDFLEANNEYSFAFHQGLKINEHNSKYETYPVSNLSSFDAVSFLQMPTIPMASIVYRRNVPLKILLNHSHGDFLLLCNLLSHGKAWFFKEVMSVYRVHPNGGSYHYGSFNYFKRRTDELYQEAKLKELSYEVRKQIAHLFVEHVMELFKNYKKQLSKRLQLKYLKLIIKIRKPENNYLPYYYRIFKQIIT